ncbi:MULTISPECIES: hypothetical protein [Haloferax]|uniref:DUF7305 domain-containing protein n=1 Tax=Haloferax marinum TaxID=2666143 RepID=A0A6A8GE02_9EURY|nr:MULTISPECIES: hypothetical protein [Haloferax]KAB1191150.1 hypothetical protein Hfx1150_15830 [Haloferax sp. CBA1150]MRW98036.1 hypothetical protein [Haloferax marinum]
MSPWRGGGAGRRKPKSNPRVPWLYAVVRDTTAQSEGLAVVLMLSMVLLGTLTVLVVGGAAIGDSRQNVQISKAEHAMRQLDVGTSSVVFDNADRSSVELGVAAGDGQLRTTDDGWIRVEIQDADTDFASENRSRTFQLGTASYQNGDTTVAYQGGGVWRSDGNATTMVARPEFHYRNGTLTIPVVNITESNSLYEDVEVVETASFERWYPNATDGRPHKLENSKVVVTVQSEYYEAWGQYFEDETDGIVTYDHAQQTVSVKFLALPSTFSIQNGIVATSGTGSLTLAGTGAYTDSYDSTTPGGYAVSRGENGDIAAVGDVTLKGNSSVWGDVYAGGTVTMTGGPTLNGDANVINETRDYDPSGSYTHNGNVAEIEGVATIEPIDGYVRQQVEAIRVSNDNVGHPQIDNGTHRLVLTSGDSGAIEAGSYYLTDLTLSGSKLTLDTTGGDITLAVRDYVYMEKSKGKLAEMDVYGPGNVTILILGESSNPNGYDFQMTQGTSVSVPNDESPRLRIYGTSSFDAQIKGDSSPINVYFVGLIYAPAGTDGTGSVNIRQAEVFGGIVTGSLYVDQYGAVHYDEALGMIDLPRSPTVSRLEYLHVGHHQVAIRET